MLYLEIDFLCLVLWVNYENQDISLWTLRRGKQTKTQTCITFMIYGDDCLSERSERSEQ